MPRMRGRLYSSCASSTWSLPSALTACWAKMSRISCVRSITRACRWFSRKRCCDGSSSSSTSRLSASRSANASFSSSSLPLPTYVRCAGRGAVLVDAADRPDARGARQLVDLGQLLLGVRALRQHREDEAALRLLVQRLACTWNHRAIMPPAVSPDDLASRTLALVDIASPSLAEAPLYDYVKGSVPLERAYDDGESVLYAKRSGKPLVLLAGHTDTVPEQGNLPGRVEDGWVHGLGATDMKGGLAVMIELARWAADAELAYDLGLLFFPREELGPAAQPAPGAVRGDAARRRGGARDLPRADRQHAPARLPRQPQRAGRLRGRVGALGAAVAGRERGQGRDGGAARHPRAGAARRGRRRACSSARCCR